MNFSSIIDSAIEIFIAAIILLSITSPFLRIIINRNKRRRENTPVLLSSLGQNLIHGHTGTTPGGMNYTATVSRAMAIDDKPTASLFYVELPFQTALHLLGIPRAIGGIQNVGQFKNFGEPVQLEGNYSSYFALYAAPQQQVQTRYVLDPKAMVFTIDFCAHYYWEIINDNLYFLSESAIPDFSLVDKFVEEIRPAVEIKPSKRSYRQYGQKPHQVIPELKKASHLKCPLCQNTLDITNELLACPQGHGALLTGSQMVKLRQDNSQLEALTRAEVVDDTNRPALKCPSCAHTMKAQRYPQTSVSIDVCIRCPYRWIDVHELAIVF